MLEQRQFRPNPFERLGAQWCRIMHGSPMWPVRGRYRCRACGRSYVVPWASESAAEPAPIQMRPNLAAYSVNSGNYNPRGFAPERQP
jgi:hypothetical protein